MYVHHADAAAVLHLRPRPCPRPRPRLDADADADAVAVAVVQPQLTSQRGGGRGLSLFSFSFLVLFSIPPAYQHALTKGHASRPAHTEVAIGGSREALKKLEAKLGIDLTTPSYARAGSGGTSSKL